MLYWLLAVVVLAILWAAMWKGLPKMAFGVLIGLAIGWLFAKFMASYLATHEGIPIWLPPLPLATIAVLLLTVGLIVLIRAHTEDRAKGQHKSDRDKH